MLSRRACALTGSPRTLLSVRQVARLLGVSLPIVYLLCGLDELIRIRQAIRSHRVVCQNSIPRLDDGRVPCEPGRAMSLVLVLLSALRAALRTRTDLTLEN